MFVLLLKSLFRRSQDCGCAIAARIVLRELLRISWLMRSSSQLNKTRNPSKMNWFQNDSILQTTRTNSNPLRLEMSKTDCRLPNLIGYLIQRAGESESDKNEPVGVSSWTEDIQKSERGAHQPEWSAAAMISGTKPIFLVALLNTANQLIRDRSATCLMSTLIGSSTSAMQCWRYTERKINSTFKLNVKIPRPPFYTPGSPSLPPA